jgi:hypothetical protein
MGLARTTCKDAKACNGKNRPAIESTLVESVEQAFAQAVYRVQNALRIGSNLGTV